MPDQTPPSEWFHCLRCDRDVPASEVHEQAWMPGRIGTFHSCGDYAHPAWETHANAPSSYPDPVKPPKAVGWHHSTRSVAAHCFEDDRPLCQDSDPGEIVDRLNPGRLLGRICEDCRAVYKSRILHAIARSKGHVTGGSEVSPASELAQSAPSYPEPLKRRKDAKGDSR